MVFKPDLGVNGVRWGRSVYALGGNAVRDVCKEQIKSVIDCALSSRPDDQTHWGEKKEGGVHIRALRRKCTYVDGNKVRAGWMDVNGYCRESNGFLLGRGRDAAILNLTSCLSHARL